jgi:3-dehydroquinate synthase
MIGAFHQPLAVLADTDTLATLPPRELAAGMAEVIKYGLIVDAEFFAWLERNVETLIGLDPQALAFAIHRSCAIKAAIVAEDERERGRRALLNLGHTFGHALEAYGEYRRWLHGEAVALGMALAARMSAALGKLDDATCERIEALLTRAGLATRATGVDTRAVLALMQLDKKADQRGLKLVLLDAIGTGVVARAPDETLIERVHAAQLAA